MKISTLRKKVLTLLLTVAILAVYSMVTLAGDTKLSGEIVVAGKNDSVVTVNGEAVKSGRTVFSSSTITTPDDASAFVTVKNFGKVKIGPNTTMVVNFDEKGISGSIEKGKMTVLNAVESVSVTAPNGKVALVNAGESVSTVQDDDAVSDSEALIPVLILLGLVGGTTIYLLTRGDNNLPPTVSGSL